jgi:hypothetical protein
MTEMERAIEVATIAERRRTDRMGIRKRVTTCPRSEKWKLGVEEGGGILNRPARSAFRPQDLKNPCWGVKCRVGDPVICGGDETETPVVAGVAQNDDRPVGRAENMLDDGCAKTPALEIGVD